MDKRNEESIQVQVEGSQKKKNKAQEPWMEELSAAQAEPQATIPGNRAPHIKAKVWQRGSNKSGKQVETSTSVPMHESRMRCWQTKQEAKQQKLQEKQVKNMKAGR